MPRKGRTPAESRAETLRFDCKATSPNRVIVAAYVGEKRVHQDRFDPASAGGREAFARDVVAKAGKRCKAAFDAEQIGKALLEQLVKLDEARAADATAGDGYHVVEGETAPSRDGTYRGGVQISDYVLRVVEQLRIWDGDEPTVVFRATIRRRGCERSFDISCRDWADDKAMKAKLYEDRGATIRMDGRPEDIRRAVAALSVPRERARTTSFGWSEDLDSYTPPRSESTPGASTPSARTTRSWSGSTRSTPAGSTWPCPRRARSTRSSGTSLTSCSRSPRRWSRGRCWRRSAWPCSFPPPRR